MSPEFKSVLDGLSQSVLFQKVGSVCSAVNSVNTTEELLSVSLNQILDLFNASRGSIYILDKDGHTLNLKVAAGMQVEEEKHMFKTLGEGIVGKVAQLKEPVIVEDISKDNRFENYKARKGYRTPSFICTPLMVKDELLGVINITDKVSGSKFKTEEIQLLDFLSTQIALNYRRIELYQKFNKVIKETESLKDKLGQSDQETEHLKRQIYIQDKLATIGKLAGGIAHEFNNPLDGVLRYTNLCIDNTKEEDVVHGYLLEIKHGLNRMVGIVRNLLACSRGGGSGSSEAIEFSKALELSISAVHSDISYKNVEIEKNIDKALPPIKDLGLERILTNLIRNALDAMEDGGKITVDAALENDNIIFSILDTGKGIPNEDIEQVFEPFFTTKDMDKGCGLGLTIVGEIVKSYNGNISVESKENKYTKFKVYIPLRD